MALSCDSHKTLEEKDDSENVAPSSLLGAACPTPPTQNQNVKGKPRLSGLQSALTPILKYLNIGNKSPTPLITHSPSKPSVHNANGCTGFVENENLTLLDGTVDSEADVQGEDKLCTPDILQFKQFDVNRNSPFPWIHAETLPEVSLLNDTCDTPMSRPLSVLSENVPGTPFCIMGVPKSPAVQSDAGNKTNLTLPLEKSSLVSSTLETAHDCPSPKRLRLELSELNSANAANITRTFNGNLTHSINPGSGDSQDISTCSTLDGSKSSLQHSSLIREDSKSVTAARHVNITQDLSASNASVQCEATSSGCKSNNATFEVSPEEKLKCVSETNSGNIPITTKHLNNTITFQGQNKTMEILNSTHSSLMKDNQSSDVTTKQNRSQSSPVLHDDCPDSKHSQSCENQTFEKNSLQKSGASTITIVVQASATSLSLQNTFESKAEGSETGADPGLQEMSGVNTRASPVSVKSGELREGTFNVNAAGGDSNAEAKDSLNTGNYLSDSVDHNTESRKSGTFLLDSSLDFKPASLCTSTPMVTNKSFNFTDEREQGKSTVAQKRLYGEGPGKLGASCSSEVPSNIVSHVKTFLTAAKTNEPSQKPPSLLAKFKPASLLPKRPEFAISGQSAARQTDALKTNAGQSLQQATTSNLTTSYNLRSTAAATSSLKLPVCGLRKPAVRSVASSMQRVGPGLKPPQAKSSSAVVPGPGKAPAGTSNLTKNTVQAKKQPLPKPVPLPAAKKKNDNSLPSDKVEAAATSDTTAKAKTLKAPTQSQRTLISKPPKHESSVASRSSECAADCDSSSRKRTLRPQAKGLNDPSDKPQSHDFETQIKVKDEEIRHLKEALSQCEAQLLQEKEEVRRLKDELQKMAESQMYF